MRHVGFWAGFLAIFLGGLFFAGGSIARPHCPGNSCHTTSTVTTVPTTTAAAYLFDDEFTSLDSSTWTHRFWWNGDTFGGGAHELQVYRPSGANGTLNLVASNVGPPLTNWQGLTSNGDGYPFSWTSGFESTGGIAGNTPIGFSRKYGYWEAKISMPAGQGLWPGFWLMGVNGSRAQTVSAANYASASGTSFPADEIDVVEVIGKAPNTLQMHLHGLAEFGATFQSASPLMGGTHIYGVDWQPGFIAWYLDGTQVARYTGTAFDNALPHYAMFNLAVGDALSWPGAPDSSTPSQASMQVDWLHVSANRGP